MISAQQLGDTVDERCEPQSTHAHTSDISAAAAGSGECAASAGDRQGGGQEGGCCVADVGDERYAEQAEGIVRGQCEWRVEDARRQPAGRDLAETLRRTSPTRRMRVSVLCHNTQLYTLERAPTTLTNTPTCLLRVLLVAGVNVGTWWSPWAQLHPSRRMRSHSAAALRCPHLYVARTHNDTIGNALSMPQQAFLVHVCSVLRTFPRAPIKTSLSTLQCFSALGDILEPNLHPIFPPPFTTTRRRR